eukprot:6178939-Pleurochrysis_carterae.AAC.3
MPGVLSVRTFLVAQINLKPAIYSTDNAKPPKDPNILRTEHSELRQQGARRQDRDLRADCLERRSGNPLRDGERGNRKSGRAVTKPRRSSTFSSAANVSILCQPDAHPPSPQKLSRTRRRRRRAPLFSFVSLLSQGTRQRPSNLALFDYGPPSAFA